MESFYLVEQLVKDRQNEICEQLCHRPNRLAKQQKVSLIKQVKQFFRRNYLDYFQDQSCCVDKI